MANSEKKKKKGKAGKTVAGVGILAVIAALLGFDPFGWGIGFGTGLGTGDDATRQEQQEDANQQENQEPETEPTATTAPAEEQGNQTVQLTEVVLKVSGDKVVYNETENTVQTTVDALVSEYADKKDSILVKVTLENAVYDTVEALKVALEGSGIKYEITE